MKTSKTLIAGIVFLTLVLSGCQRPDKIARETLSTTLRLKWVFDPGFAGEMVASKAGYFHDAGVDVALKPGGFESDPIKLVASGSDTFGVAGADSFLLARAKGVPIIAFAAGYLETPVVFYVHAASGIHSPTDFPGKRIGYQAGQDTATVYEALIRKLGVDRAKIREVPVRFDFTPFLAHQLDVWPGYAATQSYILDHQHVPYRVLVPKDYGLSYLGTVYFCSKRFMTEHPDAVQSFVDGLLRGWEVTYSSYEVAIPLISAYDPQNLSPDLIRFNLDKQKESVAPGGAQFCRYTVAGWKALEDSLLAEGLLARPVDLSEAMTMRFLDKHYGASGSH